MLSELASCLKVSEEQRFPIFIATMSLISHLLLIFVVMLKCAPTGCPPTSPHTALCVPSAFVTCGATVALLTAMMWRLASPLVSRAVTWPPCPGCLLSTLSPESLLSRRQRAAIPEFSMVSVFLSLHSLSSSWWEYLLVFPWENIQLVAYLILYLLVTELILAQLYRPFLTHHMACRILVPDQGPNSMSPEMEA